LRFVSEVQVHEIAVDVFDRWSQSRFSRIDASVALACLTATQQGLWGEGHLRSPALRAREVAGVGAKEEVTQVSHSLKG
jgi:hypothetical protein